MKSSLKERYTRIKTKLLTYEQEHLLTFFDELEESKQGQLLDELEAQNWSYLDELIKNYVLNKPDVHLPEDLRPAPYYPRQPSAELTPKYEEARRRGEDLIREGKVAAFTVAGGQGSRLGWDGPKGTFPAAPITGKSLFQVFAEQLLKTQEKYQTIVPWYLMTSRVNDEATRAFLKKHQCFGLKEENIMFFKQDTMPSISFAGKVLLEDKAHLALNPNGHGGSLSSLYSSSAVADMQRRGVTQISYFQVDNPSVQCIDPLFIGLHVLDNAEMSSKMLAKVDPFEKVGNFCLMNGRMAVIEYSDMPNALAEMRDDEGELSFKAGSIAIHIMAVDFVRRLNEEQEGRLALPFHRAEKKVVHVDVKTGKLLKPETPNAVKLEIFVFDALPLAEHSIILETDRTEEFAPIKNAEGQDSPSSSKHLQIERAARWLGVHGVKIPRDPTGQVDALIEISPLTAVEVEDLQDVDLPEKLEVGESLLL